MEYHQRKSEDLHTLVRFTGDFTVNGLQVKCAPSSTERNYANPWALAGLLGAMLECNFSDFEFRGITTIMGTGEPSTNHNNGFAIDMGYLKTEKKGGLQMHLTSSETETGWPNFAIERQRQFFAALTKFGWDYLLVYAEESKCDEIAGTEAPYEKKDRGYAIKWDETKKHYNHLHAQSNAIRDGVKELVTKEKEF